jgi:glycosyltransferase involved in cell wall biosynthesis
MVLSRNDWILLVTLLNSALLSTGYLISVYQATKQLPRLILSDSPGKPPVSVVPGPKLSVIIPAFNEEENIEDCAKSVINSSPFAAEQLEIWVVDDQSSDRTLAILQALQVQLADPRFHLLVGRPRPAGQVWTGKNWACQQAAEQATGEFLLFIDADVRLKPGAIAAVMQTAIAQQLDFLTCIPTIVCGSWVEWLVQPLMFINLMVSLNSAAVKDPRTQTTYALGPFLWFRASAYRAVGMHQGVARYLAEDVAFARRMKHQGFKLRQFLGPDLATLRMYRNWATLWEGWTKVLYVGAQRSLSLMGLLVVVMGLVYTVPWLGLGVALYQALHGLTLLGAINLGLAGLAISAQYSIRRLGRVAFGTPTTYWWCHGLGGVVVALLAIASVIKTETGWGWTWRGRKLESLQ